MSKKNKKKQQQLKQQQSNLVQSKPSLNSSQKNEIEKTYDELQSFQPVNQLSEESVKILEKAEKEDNILIYWNYLKDINKRLEGKNNWVNEKSNKLNEEENRINILKKEIEDEKRAIESLKTELKKKIEEYNKKDKELTEREFAIDSGEYTTVIRRLLDTIKDTEKKVFTDTENLLKEINEVHSKNLREFINYYSEITELKKQWSELQKEKKKFEIEKQILVEELKEEYEEKYAKQLNIEIQTVKRLELKLKQCEHENAYLRQLYENMQNVFGSSKPEEILKKELYRKQELEELKRELNERPFKFELEIKQAQIEELQAKINEYESKAKEVEILELKQTINNIDYYILENNLLKNQIEAAKVREETLKKTIRDLTVTIDQLKDVNNKKSFAFEFAKKCDDSRDLKINYLEKSKNNPKDLNELCNYIQQWMAFNSEKPFYYSLDTIRIFLAGLYMSSITIIEGISGTGKTSLPREFAKSLLSDENYIGIDEEKYTKAPYRICAIQSGWRDNMDLMGYYNSFEQKYKETDFFKALYVANQPKYSDTLFLIILDEMNLSRPEHYFADFLSLLEQSPNERFIGLSNTPFDVLPALIKGGKLRVPENVRFIGTANHDETTLEFAPKTYDRSNVIEMPKNQPNKKDIKKLEVTYNVSYSWLKSQFEEAEKKHKIFVKEFNNFINKEELKLLLMEKGIGIGNRFENQAEKFISVFIESGKDRKNDLAKAVDHLITSRFFRALKNRYDIDKANLTKFKDDYIELFIQSFEYEPKFAKELLNSEIEKKS